MKPRWREKRLQRAIRSVERVLAESGCTAATIDVAAGSNTLVTPHGGELGPFVVERLADGGVTNPATSKQPAPDAATMCCTRCEVEKPIDKFRLRADRPHRRHTRCEECILEIANQRYLSVTRQKALAEVGLEFDLTDTDELGGLRCTECEKPLRAGQRVMGETDLRHARCPR